MIRGLPYDAELEYLESNGTQYIDTGLPIAPNFYLDATFSIPSSFTHALVFMGTTTSNDFRFWVCAPQINKTINCGLIHNAISTTALIADKPSNVYIKFFDGEQVCKLDGTTIVSAANTSNAAAKAAWLAQGNLYIGRSSLNEQFNFIGKIFAVKVYDSNNTLIRDFIPVRVGTVGYMYDRISKQLFGNSGTGSFVLGPDKTYPVLSLHSYGVSRYGVSRFGKIGAGARMVRYSYDAEVEYLESTGTQWIDTGIVPTATSSMEADFQFNTTANIQLSGVWGSSGRFQFGLASGRFAIGLGSVAIDVGAADTNIHRFAIDSPNNMVKLDSIVKTEESIQKDFRPYTIPIFAQRDASLIHNFCNARLYSYKIYSNNSRVRDFIPVRFMNEQGVSEGAMYDKVSGELFRNQGTGAFVFGPDKLPYDTEVEYLETTGTQWIDTGIRLSSQTDEVDAIFYSTTSSNRIIFGSRTSANSQNFGCAWGSNEEILVDVNNGNYSTSRAVTQQASPTGLYTIHASRQKRMISGPAQATNTTLADIFTTAHNCYLFYGSGNFWTTQKFVGRFYSFTVKRNGALIRDFIPVRVGNVGYMYDRISKRLFGNDGTGDFIIGPDIPSSI